MGQAVPALPPPGMPGPGPDTEPHPPVSDTVERMLRPQGLFQHRLPPPAEWQQPYPPGPGAYPPDGQYPQANPYQQGSPPPPAPQYPAGNQYPPTGAFQEAAPQPWGPAPTGAAPTGAMPPAAPGQPGPGYGPVGQYPPGGGYQDPYGNGQFPGGQQFPGGPYGQEQFPGGQFGPGQASPGQFGPGQSGGGVQYGPDGLPLAGGGAGGPGLLDKLPFKRPRVLVGAAAALVIVIVVAVVLSSQGGSSNTARNSTVAAGSTPSATASASSGTAATTQAQAATSLSGLLAQSGGDRADVSAAVVDVEGCGNSLAKDAQVFSKAAANRRTLLTKLGQLPGRSALPPAMITDLTGAWQASATVDADLAKWAQDQVGHCKKGNTKDPNYQATIPFDSKATNDKNAFVQLWNPLAKKDGLPTRQSGDL